MRFTLMTTATAAALLAWSGGASAAVVLLDFEGIGDQTPVGDFYDGNGGPDLGVVFSSNALAIIDADAGGSGNINNEPSPDTVLFFLTGGAATLNYLPGFETGFSFFYTAINNPGSIDVYDGLDGTGMLLASLNLPTTPSGPGDPTGQFGPFSPIGVSFSGIARSIDFGGVGNQIAFDNITFGSSTPVIDDPAPIPVPGSLPLLAGGLALAAGVARRRRRG